MINEKSELINRIQAAIDLISLPDRAADSLRTAALALTASADYSNRFKLLYSDYPTSDIFDYKTAISEMQSLSAKLGINRLEGNALLLLAMLDCLREKYLAASIPHSIYLDTVADLRYKIDECYELFGVFGITDDCAFNWYPSVFSARVIALGRLQFIYKKLGYDCTVNGVKLTADTMAADVHIPRTGTPLDRQSVLDSYDRAARFFGDRFKGDSVIICCRSWLLYPKNLEFLSPTSNLRAFYGDFNIVESGEYPDYTQVWRLFDREYHGDIDALPQNTSLRRAYADLIRRGEPTGWGSGVRIHKKPQ